MEEAMKMDGFDDCVIGVCYRFAQQPIIAYDLRKVFKKLMNESDMTEEEAAEWWMHNQIGAWMGPGTPCFIDTEEGVDSPSLDGSEKLRIIVP